MWWLIVIAVIVTGLSSINFFIGILNDPEEHFSNISQFIITVTLIILTVYVIHNYKTNTPTALDVYNGKTEMKITKEVVNEISVSCDTVIVFK